MASDDTIQCPHCSTRIRIKSESTLGKRVKCPKCSEAFVAQRGVPDRSSPAKTKPAVTQTKPAAEPTELTAVQCPHCDAKFRLKPSALGKARSCPKCSEEFTPRASKSAATRKPAARPAPKDSLDDDDDFLSNLNAATKDSFSAEAEEEPEEDIQQKKPTRAAKSKSSRSSRSSSSGGGGLGVVGWMIGGTIGASIGAAIWVAVGYFTLHEVGWIAWGVGALTGLGVKLAADAGDGTDGASGMTAAGISVLAVLAGKYLVVHFLINHFIQAAGAAGAEVQQAGDAIKQAVFLDSFSFHDILWFGLAAVSAFKIGSGSAEE